MAVDYEAVLADLQDKRAKLDAAIAAIEQYILGRPAPTTSTPPPETGSGEVEEALAASVLEKAIQDDTFFSLSATEAARKYLMMTKRPAATGDMADALRHGGYLTTAKNFYSNLYTTLKRSNDFVNVKGKWGLAEWYPNRPKNPRKDRDGETSGGGEADD